MEGIKLYSFSLYFHFSLWINPTWEHQCLHSDQAPTQAFHLSKTFWATWSSWGHHLSQGQPMLGPHPSAHPEAHCHSKQNARSNVIEFFFILWLDLDWEKQFFNPTPLDPLHLCTVLTMFAVEKTEIFFFKMETS